jgi:antitoxin (DNA-binding transcriptional repressor) of toxin-antitoxin stability system
MVVVSTGGGAMSTVSVGEFAYNPGGMLARVERGETIQVTRQGQVIAVLLPGGGSLGRYAQVLSDPPMRVEVPTTDPA